ncbi:GPI mannosyltransferase 1 [Drosophila albomicans]|uniref:GPI alpha-1,4-mannosyltransferase I, catalytic subunit n=1 Tax=Drosophila albomicans TaxID=7291 RepID=A0A6P8Y5C2_DROAB|nr:GPI mannosyltransferase 1 [Drosophila albomicans]
MLNWQRGYQQLLKLSFPAHLVISAFLRLTLICYAQIHDAKSTVPYTDIDYKVVTDGARFILDGGTPFARHTYRYSPIMAYIQIPNIMLHPVFGKLIYSLCDLLVGQLIYALVRLEAGEATTIKKKAIISACCWLYNPLTAVISTRGSGDSFTSLFVISCIYLLVKSKDQPSNYFAVFCAGLAHGFVIHLRLYPIFFSLAYYLCLSGGPIRNSIELIQRIVVPNKQQICLVLGTLIGFTVFTLTFYKIYGWQYLHESYFYHFVRKDVRHNFSLYFLMQYLNNSDAAEESTLFIKFLIMGPQLLLVVYLSVSFAQLRQTLPFCVFSLAFVIVTYNSVVTSQYFVWYLAVLPLCLTKFQLMSCSRCVFLLVLWICGQALWLLPAYLLEFKTWHTFNWIGLQGAVFFIINNYILTQLITNYDCKSFEITNKKRL